MAQVKTYSIRQLNDILRKSGRWSRKAAKALGIPPEQLALQFSSQLAYLFEEERGGGVPAAMIGKSYLTVFENGSKLPERSIVGTYGGAKLEHPQFGVFLDQFADLVTQYDMSLVGGGGPGKVMCGLYEMVAQHRGNRPASTTKRFAVPSGLNDEPYMFVGDEGYTTYPQPRNEIREAMIWALSNAGSLIAPGFFGTYSELFNAILHNYVTSRGTNGKAGQPRPIVLLDISGKKYRRRSYWRPVVDLVSNGIVMGSSKDVDIFVYLVNVNRPHAAERAMSVFTHFQRHNKCPETGWRRDGYFRLAA